jgi:hypothetical protein
LFITKRNGNIHWNVRIAQRHDNGAETATNVPYDSKTKPEIPYDSCKPQVQATYRIRATPLSVVRKHSLFQLPAALFSAFCLWNSAPPLSIAFLTAFDHVDTRFTPLSCHAYIILGVRMVHCRHSGGNGGALKAWASARSFRDSPRCAVTLTMNLHAPRSTLYLTRSIIVFMMSAFASPASVVRGPIPIHLDTLSRVVSLSHKYIYIVGRPLVV